MNEDEIIIEKEGGGAGLVEGCRLEVNNYRRRITSSLMPREIVVRNLRLPACPVR